MSLLTLLAAADAGPVEQIAKTFGANLPALIANAISFVLVALILKKWAVGPIQKALEDRRAAIAQGLADATRAREDLAVAHRKAQDLLAETGTQTHRIMEESRVAAARVAETETQKAVAAAADIIAKARHSNEAELARLKAELRKEFGRLVVAASMEVTGKILTLEDQKRLAEETQRQIAA
ncbi:MAG: ATP synthase F0 subunit B [Proteobacteria bacterium]|nr:ATP synthase F0 subunit B [Pseudomonadota bacterium]